MVRRSLAVAVVAAGLGVCSAQAHAARAAAICPALSMQGAGKIQWSVIGNASCGKTKPWLLKILGTHGAPNAQAKVAAPTGFHCRATNNAKGIPSVGFCYTGTIKFPTNGFQWFGR